MTLRLFFACFLFGLLQGQSVKNYQGTLGNKKIFAVLIDDETKIVGYYIYNDIGYNISLQGSGNKNKMNLTEYFAAKPGGSFSLSATKGGGYTGVFTTKQGKAYKVVLNAMKENIMPIPESLLGDYTFDDGACHLNLHITKRDTEYLYTLKNNKKTNSGRLYIYREPFEKRLYLRFSGTHTTQYDTGTVQSNRNVEGVLDDNQIIIQNYGNAMNPYMQLEGCNAKYIYLKK